MTSQELSTLYEERIPAIFPLIRFYSRGHEDLEQCGCISVFEGLKEQPNCTDNWLKQRARWEMNAQRKRGHSVDKKNLHRKYEYEMVPLIEGHDSYWDDMFPTEKHIDLETHIINKITVERFLKVLTPQERKYVRMKMLDGLNANEIMIQTAWKYDDIKSMRKSIREKINKAFA